MYSNRFQVQNYWKTDKIVTYPKEKEGSTYGKTHFKLQKKNR